MDNGLIKDIYDNMKHRSTEELTKIWKDNDTRQYSEQAFKAIALILEERGVTLPEL